MRLPTAGAVLSQDPGLVRGSGFFVRRRIIMGWMGGGFVGKHHGQRFGHASGTPLVKCRAFAHTFPDFG